MILNEVNRQMDFLSYREMLPFTVISMFDTVLWQIAFNSQLWNSKDSYPKTTYKRIIEALDSTDDVNYRERLTRKIPFRIFDTWDEGLPGRSSYTFHTEGGPVVIR